MKELIADVTEALSANAKLMLWSGLFGLMATIFSTRNRSFVAYVISILTAVPLGTLSGNLASQYGLAGGEIYFTVAVVSLLSQDFVKFLFSLSGFINKNSDTIFQAGLDWSLTKLKVKTKKASHKQMDLEL